MTDFGLTGIWLLPNSISDARPEFHKEFNSVTETESDGLHSFYFCNYHDYSVTIEVLYTIILDKKAFFLWSPMRVILQLDDELNYSDIHIDDEADIIPDVLLGTGDLEYIGDVCTDVGNMLYLFSLTSDKAVNEITNLYDNDLIPLNYLIMATEDDYADMALHYAQHIANHFNLKVQKAIVSDAPYEGIDENPYQNKFYDRNPDITQL